MESVNLDYRSDENLILFHAEEFIAIYCGESVFGSLPDSVKSLDFQSSSVIIG